MISSSGSQEDFLEIQAEIKNSVFLGRQKYRYEYLEHV
jgi:hypothetical protein